MMMAFMAPLLPRSFAGLDRAAASPDNRRVKRWSVGFAALLATACLASEAFATPPCREGNCGPDYLMVAFVILYTGFLPWLVGTLGLLILGSRAKVPGWLLLALVPVKCVLAFVVGFAAGSALDASKIKVQSDFFFFAAFGVPIALFEAAFVKALLFAWSRKKPAQPQAP
jgi:hypothetical protein